MVDVWKNQCSAFVDGSHNMPFGIRFEYMNTKNRNEYVHKVQWLLNNRFLSDYSACFVVVFVVAVVAAVQHSIYSIAPMKFDT